jgi:small subunit ribosomal protein S1
MAETSERTEPEAAQATAQLAVVPDAPNVAHTDSASPTEQAAPQRAEGAERSEASEPTHAEAAAAPPEAGDESAHDVEGDDEGDHAASAGDEAAGTPGDPTKKRKRRRRRKRKDGGAGGEVAAAGEGGEPGAAPRAPEGKKKESHAPFAHLFSGAQGKRHAFAVGEVVAGRVQRVEYGVIVVDLFGKATAIADEYEPREVPPLPLPELPELAGSDTSAGQVSGQVSGEVSGQVSGEATTAEAPAVDAASSAEAAPPAADSGAEFAPAEPSAALLAGEPEPPVASEPEAAPLEATSSGELHSEHASSASGELFAPADDELDDEHEDDHEVALAPPAHEKPEPPKIGQVFKGRVGAVSESGHVAILNRIIEGRSVREQLETKRQEHKRVHGVVYGFNRGGFDVLVEGLRAFCPASAMALEDIGDPLDFVGRKLEFLLPASRAGSKDLIVSRRSILERLQRRKTKEFLRSLTPGQKFKGRVTAVRDFGLFVDIGGVEGLVHQSELSYAFGVKPSSVAKVGDEIDVQVLRIGGDARRDSGKKERLTRVSLSVKALLQDPWDAHADALSEGNVHKGKVVRATEFGAFIEIVPEIEGLLHITELGRDLKHGSQAVKEGEDIYVVVDRVDRRSRRISLSKLSPAEVAEFEAGSLTKDEASARNLRQGSNVKLKIERIEPRVLHARVTGTVGRRGRAFIPSSETGTDRGTDLRKRFPIGSEIEAKIIGIDRDGSLKCSVKALLIDEERQAVKNYRREAAKQGFGTFGDLLRAKLGEAQTKS